MEELERPGAQSPFRNSIDAAGIQAGVEEARSHSGELTIGATSVDHGTVKLSFAGRWEFLKAAVFGTYSKDKGGAIGGEATIKIGK